MPDPPPAAPEPAPSTGPGADSDSLFPSRSGDLLLLAVLFLFLTGISWARLRVYYQITVAEIRLAMELPDGTSVPIELPEAVQKDRSAVLAAERLRELWPARFERYLQRWKDRLPPEREGARFVWTVRYSEDSLALDRETVISLPDPRRTEP